MSDDDFCGWTCPRKEGKDCDLCAARKRHRKEQARLAAGLPTLQHRPFAKLARPPRESRRG